MYPLGMDPLMRELCKFHEKLWRENHPEDDSDIYAVEIAKVFFQSAAERGLARLVKGPEGDLIWEATPKIFRDLDWMTAELLDHADDMERAIEVFHGLRQRAFDLLEAIGEDPLKGCQTKQAETPERDMSEPPSSG